MVNLPFGYAMDTDKYNYIVGKLSTTKKKNKDGTVSDVPSIKDATYYRKPDQALQNVIERMRKEIIHNSSGSLKDAIKECEDMAAQFKAELDLPAVETLVLEHHFVGEKK